MMPSLSPSVHVPLQCSVIPISPSSRQLKSPASRPHFSLFPYILFPPPFSPGFSPPAFTTKVGSPEVKKKQNKTKTKKTNKQNKKGGVPFEKLKLSGSYFISSLDPRFNCIHVPRDCNCWYRGWVLKVWPFKWKLLNSSMWRCDNSWVCR